MTQNDVLCGRGAVMNCHMGNQIILGSTWTIKGWCSKINCSKCAKCDTMLHVSTQLLLRAN